MLQHARDEQHHFRKEDISILSREHDWIRRGIKEAIFIKSLSPSINIDPGRHSLSSHFDTILKGQIRAPPAPIPHNAATEVMINTIPRRQGRPRREGSSMQQSQQTAPKQMLASQQTAPKQPLQQQHQQQQQQQPVRRSERIRDLRDAHPGHPELS